MFNINLSKHIINKLIICLALFLSYNFNLVNAQDGKISIEDARVILNKIGYQIAENNSGMELENGINKFKRLHGIYSDNNIIDSDTVTALQKAEQEKFVLVYLVENSTEVQKMVNEHFDSDLVFYVDAFPQEDSVNHYNKNFYHIYLGIRTLNHDNVIRKFYIDREITKIFVDDNNGSCIPLDLWHTDNSYQYNDWYCVPYNRVGPIKSNMNIQDLNNLFGNDNLKKSQIYGAEGIGVYDFTIIYPDTDKELIIYWKDNKYGEKPESVTVKQKNSPWKLIYDIGIGSNLDAVSTTNKASIDINGFGWDYGGYVNDWHNGVLSKYKGFVVRFGYNGEIPQELYGDKKLKFGELGDKENIVISDFSVSLSR